MSRPMTDDELRAFLSHGTRTGKLGTTRADGRPHVAPIWFVLDDDGTVVFMTGRRTVKGTALRHDPRACLCVDDEAPPFAFVVIEGAVELSEDLDEMLPWSIKIARRYMGDDQAEQFGRRNAVAGEMLVRLPLTKVVALFDIAD
jgi:PPOX class probable F420-dependent enzyme